MLFDKSIKSFLVSSNETIKDIEFHICARLITQNIRSRCLISGGFLVRKLIEKYIKPSHMNLYNTIFSDSDIDIFINIDGLGLSDLKSFITYFENTVGITKIKTNYDKSKYKNLKKYSTRKYHDNSGNNIIQIIFLKNSNNNWKREIMDNFDFHFLKMGISTYQFLYTRKAIKDLLNLKITLTDTGKDYYLKAIGGSIYEENGLYKILEGSSTAINENSQIANERLRKWVNRINLLREIKKW